VVTGQFATDERSPRASALLHRSHADELGIRRTRRRSARSTCTCRREQSQRTARAGITMSTDRVAALRPPREAHCRHDREVTLQGACSRSRPECRRCSRRTPPGSPTDHPRAEPSTWTTSRRRQGEMSSTRMTLTKCLRCTQPRSNPFVGVTAVPDPESRRAADILERRWNRLDHLGLA